MQSVRRQALILLFLGLLAAFAALFGPAEPWGPVDVGATGAALFTLVLAAAIWLFARHGDEVFAEEMSLVERRAWVGLIFLTIVLASFATQLWALSRHQLVPEGIGGLLSHQFTQRLGTLIIAWSLISYLIGRAAAGIEADERDLLLRHRADRAGDWALTLIVIASVCVLVSVPQSRLAWWLEPIVLANVLIGLLIARSFVEHLVLTYAYRAGRA
jgi:hypothetical protein